jgi:3-isopropylmalate/(R)-2-methylmalate dehydratase small subunit
MRVWRFSDNVDTDQIIPGPYLAISDPAELARHLFESVRPGLAGQVEPGDIIVAGKGFGCGSSREHAVHAIRASGISLVVAESFARIFYRNSINLGLPILQVADTKDISEGDVLEVDPDQGTINDLTRGKSYQGKKMPEFIQRIIQAGGLENYARLQTRGGRSEDD